MSLLQNIQTLKRLPLSEQPKNSKPYEKLTNYLILNTKTQYSIRLISYA